MEPLSVNQLLGILDATATASKLKEMQSRAAETQPIPQTPQIIALISQLSTPPIR